MMDKIPTLPQRFQANYRLLIKNEAHHFSWLNFISAFGRHG
jgi:hypothetical protein